MRDAEGARSDAEILAGIEAVAREHLQWRGSLERDTSLRDALALDSIRLLTLVVEVENRFRVCLEEGDEHGLETAGDLVDLLRARLERDD